MMHFLIRPFRDLSILVSTKRSTSHSPTMNVYEKKKLNKLNKTTNLFGSL